MGEGGKGGANIWKGIVIQFFCFVFYSFTFFLPCQFEFFIDRMQMDAKNEHTRTIDNRNPRKSPFRCLNVLSIACERIIMKLNGKEKCCNQTYEARRTQNIQVIKKTVAPFFPSTKVSISMVTTIYDRITIHPATSRCTSDPQFLSVFFCKPFSASILLSGLF